MSTSLSTVRQEPLATVVVADASSSTSNATSRASDFAELCKPRILAMALVAMAVAGIAAASGVPNWIILLHALIGTSLIAASSSIVNQVFERDVDAVMPRTQSRPIAAGRVSPAEASWLAAALLIGGIAYLYATTNGAVVLSAAMTWFLYAFVYTPLKRVTVLNTVVGAIPGALPIVIGWTAASSGTIDERTMWLFALLFVWQFPHFMAIAWIYRTQYAEAGFRMMSYRDTTGRRSGLTAVVGATILLGLVAIQPSSGWVPCWPSFPQRSWRSANWAVRSRFSTTQTTIPLEGCFEPL